MPSPGENQASLKQLKNLGYLSGPRHSFLAKLLSPQKRGIVWPILVSGLLAGGFWAAWLASVSKAHPSLLPPIALAFFLLTFPLVAVTAILQLLLLQWALFRHFLVQWRIIHLADLIIGLLFLLLHVVVLTSRSLPSLTGLPRIHWLSLALLALFLGSTFRNLALRRLYWFDQIPPPRRLPMRVLAPAFLLLLFFPWFGRGRPLAIRPSLAQPTILLAFDLPKSSPSLLARGDLFREKLFQSSAQDIAAAWISLGTGVPAQLHLAGLFGHSVGPIDQLSEQDPIQHLLIQAGKLLHLSSLSGAGTRMSPYAWEILSQLGLPCLSLGYWSSFPAAAEDGRQLTERWSLHHQLPPYGNLPPLKACEEMDQAPALLALPPQQWNDALQQVWEREVATWQLLLEQRTIAALTIAYFPLADVLRENGASEDPLVRLAAWRKEKVSKLLASLEEDCGVVLICSTGRESSSLIEWSFQANEVAWPLVQVMESPPQLASALLARAGVPPGPDMDLPAALPVPAKKIAWQRIGYPGRGRHAEADRQWLEQLQSLGYIH
jgi:hypothetical protein